MAIDFCPNGKPTVSQSITCSLDFSWQLKDLFSSYFFQHVLISFISISVVILIIGIVIIIVRRETLCNCWLVEKAGIVLDLSTSTSNFFISTKSQDIIIRSVKWKLPFLQNFIRPIYSNKMSVRSTWSVCTFAFLLCTFLITCKEGE